MSLVAYGNSDSEDEEYQDEAVSSSTTSTVTETTSSGTQKKTDAADELVSSSTMSVPKRQRETVRITIPSLEQFKDEDSIPEPNKKPTYKSGSSLFSILPPPKHSGVSITHNFKPHVLTKHKETKKNPPIPVRSTTSISSTHSSEFRPDVPLVSIPSQNEGGFSPKFDFFSLDSSNEVSASDSRDVLLDQTPSTLFSSLPEPVQSSSTYAPLEQALLPSVSCSVETLQGHYYSPAVEAADKQSFLKDEEFLKIKGKREREEINIIDVNGADQLTGKDEWLMQSLTEEKVERPSKRRHGMPTQQQKRKHQITYLAFQAKERELDLKNQWAMNSLTRRETQAKYGF